MIFEPSFEEVLVALPEERLRQLMFWYVSAGQSVEARSEKLKSVLDELNTIDVVACFSLLEGLSLKDKVMFTLLREFGVGFANHTAFQALTKRVVACLELKEQGESCFDVSEVPVFSAV